MKLEIIFSKILFVLFSCKRLLKYGFNFIFSNKFYFELFNFVRKKTAISIILNESFKKNKFLVIFSLSSGIVQALCEIITILCLIIAVNTIDPNFSISDLFDTYNISFLDKFINVVGSKFQFVFWLGIAVFFQSLQSISQYFFLAGTGIFMTHTKSFVISKVFKRIFSFNFSTAARYKSGDLIDYVYQSNDGIGRYIDCNFQLLIYYFLVFSYVIVSLILNPYIALFCPILIYSLKFIQTKGPLKKAKVFAIKSIHDYTNITSRMNEYFQSQKFLFSSGLINHADKTINSSIIDYKMNSFKEVKWRSFVVPLTKFLPYLFIFIASLCLTLFGNFDGKLITPIFISIILVIQRLGSYLTLISYMKGILTENEGRMDKINKIFSDFNIDFRRVGGKKFNKLKSGIDFKNINFSYSSKRKVLNNFNYKFEKGKSIGVVGVSGSGKSTLLDLLSGVLSPDSGSITIDEVAIDKIDIDQWQKRIGIVSQDIALFNDSIFNNLSFGLEEVSFKSLEEATKIAQAYEFISNLPKGFDTIIGDKGYRLSGGQKQRISIARALLKKPEILILDEATSALDTKSEKDLQLSLLANRFVDTKIIIAHRLSTIIDCDNIIVLEEGKIIQQGCHDELIRKSGRYKDLWQLQSKKKK